MPEEKMELGLVEYLESAHKVGEGPLHGHNFRVEIVVEGEYAGGEMDFHKLRAIVESEVIKELDHIDISRIIEVPVVENIARYVAKKLKPKLPLKSVSVWETEDRWCKLVVEK